MKIQLLAIVCKIFLYLFLLNIAKERQKWLNENFSKYKMNNLTSTLISPILTHPRIRHWLYIFRWSFNWYNQHARMLAGFDLFFIIETSENHDNWKLKMTSVVWRTSESPAERSGSEWFERCYTDDPYSSSGPPLCWTGRSWWTSHPYKNFWSHILSSSSSVHH